MNTLTLSRALPTAVKLVAFSAVVFACFKVFLVAEAYSVLVAILFAGLHLPLCLFSCLVVWWFYATYPVIGFLALVSTLLNALLI